MSKRKLMRNFFEQIFNGPTLSSEQEPKEVEQEIGKEKSETKEKLETSRREFLKTCGLAAAGMFFGPLLKVEKALSQIESGEIGIKNGINYASLEAQEKLKIFERFYGHLNQVEAPIIIGTTHDFLRNQGIGESMAFISRFFETAAFAFSGKSIDSKAAEKFGIKPDYTYIIFHLHNVENLKAQQMPRFAVHEGFHAKHFAEQNKRNPADKTGLTRYPQLTHNVNRFLEEIITNAETLDFLENQEANPRESVLMETERKAIPLMKKGEKGYFLTNYLNYYAERYGSEDPDIPWGKKKGKDEIDRLVEKLFKRYDFEEVLKERARNIE